MNTKTHVLTLSETVEKEETTKRVKNIANAVRAFVKFVQVNSPMQATANTILDQITDNQMGTNLVDFCRKAGVTIPQLKNFIESNPQELGIQLDPTSHIPTIGASATTEVTIQGAPNSQHFIRYGERLYPVCNACGQRTFAELPVCALCGHTLSLTEDARAKCIARAQASPKVIIDDGDVYVTEDDLAAAEKELEGFRKLSIEGCK